MKRMASLSREQITTFIRGISLRQIRLASGLVLFALTLIVNLVARYVILRSGTEERSSV